MSPLWLLPGAVALVGGAVILGLLRSAAEEASLLADELRRHRVLGTSARRLGDEVRVTRGALRARR
jgi:hypothetical protein